MACYSPVKAYRSLEKSEKGRYPLIFKSRAGFEDLAVEVPCGQCIGCKLERSRQWAVRCMHEASMHDENCFITLTYDDKHLPVGGSLNMKHFQDFMKRLRKKFSGKKIRFFHCGEYGSKMGRPHYHACLFGISFPDVRLHQGENKLVSSSDILAQLWPYGFNTVGAVTFESASYVARYITKKITGTKALEHYDEFSKETGEIFNEKRPEYITMSRRPGIGNSWFKKFVKDVYPSDSVIVKGKEVLPPKYYDKLYEAIDKDNLNLIKLNRRKKAEKRGDENGLRRLRVKEEAKLLEAKIFKRSYENE